MVYPISKKIVGLLVKLFLKEVKGTENIPKKGPFIVASNHRSYLDPLLLMYYIIKKTNQKVHFIAYRGRFDFLGELIIKKWAGCIPIRYNKEEISAALKEAVSILGEGGIVGIFPAAPHQNLSKPETGIARIALTAKCAILPAILKGTEEIMPAPSLIPHQVKCASLQFKKPMVFKESQTNLKFVANKVAQVILEGVKTK
ncbi:1-acyl-sn-glycerol-3-phosphate acyltransferase [Candidatus Woesearchaeota archaeon]|nr:1-acyl-sn-glycerol-3-phosphate acyltransferase [Candidatus Woesearchaeota archaeon]